MTRYSLYVLKVPLNTKQKNKQNTHKQIKQTILDCTGFPGMLTIKQMW